MLGIRDIFLIAPTPSPLHHHQQNHPISSDHHHPPPSSTTTLGVGLGIFPLLTANPPPSAEANLDNSHFWATRKCQDQLHSSKQDMLKFGNCTPESEVECVGGDCSVGGDGSVGGGGRGESSNMRICKDCGNRAKKECEYRRCRTCCRGRGYDCSTHVKSTWVPAARRRDRHMAVTVAVPGVGGGSGGDGGEGSSGSSSVAKRPRVVVPSQNANANIKQSLPDKVRAPAVFRCHRVTAISNGADELAYQATVKISGHVFTGLLYDHGVDKSNAFSCISQSHFESGSNPRNGDSASTPTVPPTSTS